MPSDGPQTGEFYNNYQNIQKIIDKEANEEQQDRRALIEEEGGDGMSPRQRSKSPQHAKNKESHASNQSTEVGKSPMIEYLK